MRERERKKERERECVLPGNKKTLYKAPAKKNLIRMKYESKR